MKNTYLTKNSNVKGFKFVRRILAAGLAAGMMITALPSVSTAQYTAPDTVVDYFSTFHGYEQNGGTTTAEYFKDAKLPQGWSEASWSPNKAWHISGYNDSNTETGTGSNIIKTFDSNIVYKLDEPVKSGKMHISFDLKTESNAATVNIGGYNTSVNDNPDDCWNNGTYNKETEQIEYYQTYSYFLKTKVENNKGYIYMPSAASNMDNALESSVKENDGKWHKYDVFINFDVTNEDKSYGLMSIYQDGTKLGNDVPMTAPYAKAQNGLKSIFIQTGWGTNDRGYFDNFYIHNWNSSYDGENFDAPRIALDYANSGVLATGGSIDVVFSENVEVEEFLSNQFEIKNVATGKKVEGISVSSIPNTSGARITLPSLESGEYEVSVKPSIKGSISDKAVENTAKFTVAGATIGDSARYYINENFNTYKGGMPADFDAAQYSNYTKEYANSLTAENRSEDDTALKLGESTDERNLEYEFNNSIYSGRFTVEFDVKHSNGGWAVGLMSAGDFDKDDNYMEYKKYTDRRGQIVYTNVWKKGYDAGTIKEEWSAWCTEANVSNGFNEWLKDETNKQSWLNEKRADITARKSKNLLIGNIGVTDAKSEDVYSAKAKSEVGTDKLNDVTVEPNAWTHVKTIVDLDAGKYYFYIGNSTTPVELEYQTATNGNYGAARFARTYLRDTDGNYKVLGGISGLRLQKYGDGTVEFDNIKVYTDKSYNDYLDFNTASTSGSTQPGWYSNKALAWSDLSKFDYNGENARLSTDGVNALKDSSDKAIKFTQSWQYYTHPFAVPVKANSAFTVEFDLFAQDDTGWQMNLLDERYMERSVENTSTTNTAFNGKKGTASEDIGVHSIEQNGILSNKYGNSYTTRFAGPTGTNSLTANGANEFASANITYQTNKWQHIKLNFEPYNDVNLQMKMKIFVTCDGKTEESGTFWLANSEYTTGLKRFGLHDTTGLAFVVPGSSGAGISIDNLKVTETATASKAAVTSITTADEKGEQIDLTDKVYKIGDKVQDINVEFSAPLNNSDDIKDVIKLYYPQDEAGAAPQYTVTMSEDKKSATIKLTECAMNKNVTLCISNKADMGTTKLSAPDTTSATFLVETPEDKLVIEDFRLYELIQGRTVGDITCDDAWVPVSADKLDGDTHKTFNGLKIVAKGYNTGSPKKVLMMSGIYNNTDTVKDLLSASEIMNEEIPSGRFNNFEYRIVNDDNTANLLKCFIWDANTLKPLWDKLEYEKTPATSEN